MPTEITFSERLEAIDPVVKVLGRFLLTGWLAGRQKSTSFQNFKIRYQAQLAAFGYFK